MIIGILTQPLLNNYGGLLQNYALQQALLKLGHSPVTLDHKAPNYPLWHLILGRIKGYVMHFLDKKKYAKPKYVLSATEKDTIERNTQYFINHCINHTAKCERSEDYKKEVTDRGIEALVVGSDQCWRPAYNDSIEDMFLQFTIGLPIKKRISYAASFGTDKWEFTSEMTKTCSDLVKKFDIVTVREDSGILLCKEHLGIDAIHVVDPTMLLTKEDYISLTEQNGVTESDGNLFNYILDPNNNKTSFIKMVESSLGLKSFQILPTYNEDHRTKRNVKKSIEACVYPSPFAWVRAFADSKMTIVDSFHGMVFSIIFNKPFWVIGNSERGMSRFTSLLEMFGLLDRLVDEKELKGINILKPIEWDRVNRILEQKRRESIYILSNALC